MWLHNKNNSFNVWLARLGERAKLTSFILAELKVGVRMLRTRFHCSSLSMIRLSLMGLVMPLGACIENTAEDCTLQMSQKDMFI